MSESAKKQSATCCMCSQPHQLAYLFPEFQAEMLILALHILFRGRHSGKGPAAVSNQSEVVMQWKTEYVARLRRWMRICVFCRKRDAIFCKSSCWIEDSFASFHYIDMQNACQCETYTFG